MVQLARTSSLCSISLTENILHHSTYRKIARLHNCAEVDVLYQEMELELVNVIPNILALMYVLSPAFPFKGSIMV